MQNSSSVHPVIAVGRLVFYRERSSAMYSAISYALAQAVIKIPYLLMQTLLYGIIVYAMIGFEWTAAKFFLNLLFTFLTFVYFIFFCMMMISQSPDLNIFLVISAHFYATWNLFSGFIIPRPVISCIFSFSESYDILETRVNPNPRLFLNDRVFRYGGDGFPGFVQLLGACTV
ncbi:hypothetical protein Droror1_Dr00024106 [Drosera rotundifolia]